MVSNHFHYKSHQIQYLIICYRISLKFLLCVQLTVKGLVSELFMLELNILILSNKKVIVSCDINLQPTVCLAMINRYQL